MTNLDDQYVPGPDSTPQPGVPRGALFEVALDQSRVFPGTSRTIKIYVPAAYRAESPACVYVALDDFVFEAPTVFDNLIFKGEMPVTIGVAISPGIVTSTQAPGNPRFNRSIELDSLNDHLARFVVDEVIPEVERQTTPDGLPIRLSRDPNNRAVGGKSSGGIGAFTLAWERPDAFRRVFIAIGTFVSMRGGDQYPVLVRKTEPKPLRVFMQDGCNDQLTAALGEIGDWWMSNQTMQRALEFAGYQVSYVWGEGTHNVSHATAIFPDAMRFLWRDWPTPIAPGLSQNTFLQAILSPDEEWSAVEGDVEASGPLASNPQGDLVFEGMNGAAYLAGSGAPEVHLVAKPRAAGMAVGPDGRLYVADAAGERIIAYAPDEKAIEVATGIRAQDLVVTNAGLIYVTEPVGGRVWLIAPGEEAVLIDVDLDGPAGIAVSPDGLWLTIAERAGPWGYSYRVNPDGTVDAKQRFYWIHSPVDGSDSETGGQAFDREGRLYSATRMGVQVSDRNGRVRAIMPVPGGGGALGLAFGDPNFNTLHVVCSDHKLYRRKMAVRGAPGWAAPIALPPGNAG